LHRKLGQTCSYGSTAGVKCLCGGCKMSPRCVVIYFWSKRSLIVCFFTFEKKFCSCARGRQWCGISLPLMNSFSKTEAAIFTCRPCFLRAFPFISLINLICVLNIWFFSFKLLNMCRRGFKFICTRKRKHTSNNL